MEDKRQGIVHVIGPEQAGTQRDNLVCWQRWLAE